MEQNNLSEHPTPPENRSAISVSTSAVLPHRHKRAPVPVQFSLRGMLWLMVACSVYFAQLAVVWEYNTRHRTILETDRIKALTILVTWLVLTVFYLRVRLRRILLVHSFALICFAPFLIPVLCVTPLVFVRDFDELFKVLVACLFVGSLFSLPTFVLMMIVWALGSDRPRLK